MAQDVAIASSSHDENINIFYMSKIKTVYFTPKIYFCTSRWLAHKKKDRTFVQVNKEHYNAMHSTFTGMKPTLV